MKKHHVLAVTLAGINIAMLLVDTVIVATTGHRTFITDDTDSDTATIVLAGAALGLTFAALGWVVLRESRRFVRARRAARLARPVLMVGLFFLAAGFLTIYPLQEAAGVDSGTLFEVSGMVAFAALTCVVLSSLVLGLAFIGRNPLGLGGRVLGALLPMMLVTALLGVVAPGVASPVYCTMVVLAGVALLGVRAEPAAQPESRVAMASPTSAV